MSRQTKRFDSAFSFLTFHTYIIQKIYRKIKIQWAFSRIFSAPKILQNFLENFGQRKISRKNKICKLPKFGAGTISTLIYTLSVENRWNGMSPTQGQGNSISRIPSPNVFFDLFFLEPNVFPAPLISLQFSYPTPLSYILFLYAKRIYSAYSFCVDKCPTPTSLTYSSTHRPKLIGLFSGLHLSVYALFLYIILMRSASKLFAPPKRFALWLSRKSRQSLRDCSYYGT